MSDGFKTIIAVDATTVKRVKITCRCKTTFTIEIPAELVHLPTIHPCPNCGKQFAFQNWKLFDAHSRNGIARIGDKEMPQHILQDQDFAPQKPEKHVDDLPDLPSMPKGGWVN